ncbi:MAG TPA: FtsX-like permease family protein, partial [Thermoanaerobaculia bacterium]|nr:FtsX-like permease family protein [Thermoanaerobaculia bacterium]
MHTGAATVLHDGGSRATSAAGKSLRSGLLVAEAALAVVLLIGAALLARSFVRLLEIDSGFVPDNVLIAQVILPNDPDEERAAAHSDAFVKALQTRLEALPGVVSAGISNMAPLGDSTAVMGFALPTGSGEPASVLANLWVVTPGYERALGLRIRSGRFLAAADLTSGTLALVVNEELARRYLADGKPVIGRRYPGLLYGSERVTEIVGVVGNVLKDGPDRPPQPEIYVVPSDRNRGMLTEPYVLVRTTGDPLALAPAFRRLVREMEPQAAVDGVGRLTSRASRAVAQPRFAAIVLGVFALLALALAATGLYGVLTYGVSQRRREMGIRAALGATRAGLSRLILREGLVLTAAGLVLGLAVAAAVMRLMASLLFGVTPFDLLAYTTAPLALLGVAAVACLLPARRAAAADPAEALRSE